MLVRAKPRVTACPDPRIFRVSPNGLRLSGARKRVRCSRSLDGPPMRAPLFPRRHRGDVHQHSKGIIHSLARRKGFGKIGFDQYQIRS